MRSLRWFGLIAFILFVVAAFTPLANLLNVRMAGIADVGPSDAIVVMGRGGADTDGVLTNRSLRRVFRGRRILLVADPIDMPRSRALMERGGFVVRPAPTAASGPSNPESRLGLVRDIAIELTAWAYYRLTGAL